MTKPTKTCELCGRTHWERGCIPLIKDIRFCQACARELCQAELEKRKEGKKNNV